jgi:hypothetical protein
MFDRSIELITINQTNLLGSIECLNEPLICLKFNRSFDPITINRTNSLGSIGYSIESSISLYMYIKYNLI